jgi:tetratricopeptide (TPR) repeat protein
MEPKYPFSFTLPNTRNSRIRTAGEAEKKLLARYQRKQSELENSIWHLAHFYSTIGKLDQAFQWIQTLMSSTKNAEKQALYYLALGQLMEKRNDFPTAIDFYTQALSLNPTHPMTSYLSNNNLGYSLNQLNEFHEAEPYCRAAIKIDPSRHNAYKNLGVSLEGQSRFIEAAFSYIEAVEREASDPRALSHLTKLIEDNPKIIQVVPDFKERFESGKRAVDLAKNMEKNLVEQDVGSPPTELTNAAKILDAILEIYIHQGREEFTRNDVRIQVGLSRDDWMSGYTSIFQAMRADQPGGAPKIKKKYQGILRAIRRGVYTLTEYGKEYLQTKNWRSVLMGELT